MLEAIGSQVLTLHRTHIGALDLEGIQEGKRQAMESDEIRSKIRPS